MQAIGQASELPQGLVTNLEQNQRNMQIAQQAEHGANAAYHMVEAGSTPSDVQMGQLTAGTAGPMGTPLSTINQREANAARLQAAAIRAKGETGHTSISTALPANAQGTHLANLFSSTRTVHEVRLHSRRRRSGWIK